MTAVTVADLIHDAVDRGGFEAEDLRAVVGPLLREVAVIHEQGLVAPLRGLGAIGVADGRRLSIAGAPPLKPASNRDRLQDIQRPISTAFDVVGHLRAVTDGDTGGEIIASVDVLEPGQPLTHPLFVAGYETWEHQIGHHDAATDIESLGLLLASLALGLDFRVAGDLRQFVSNRRNPFAVRPELHPVIGRLIAEMAEPDRSRRAQDVASLAERLGSYRDQPVDFDLALVPGAGSGPIPRRRAAIQAALRDRLFEINRRNRLVYFTPTQQSVNLTVGSVPLLLDVRTLTPDQLATWRPPLADDVVRGKQIKLNTILRFEDAPYLPGALTKLGSQARRDRAEYGVSQLRLVVCFLRWHNLKDDKDERINSPLLLLPVELTTKRGVRDSHVMRATTPVAEVNPALRHHLRQLYAIELPETLDLEEQSVDDLHALLRAQIEATEPGVVLEKVDRPQLELVQRQAQRRLDQYRRRQAAAKATAGEPSDAVPTDAVPTDAIPTEDRRPESSPVVDDIAARPHDRPAYALNEPAASNPYRWELDLCSLTLANLNYRKMTLVRDYAQLIATDEPSDAFDRIFSLDARPLDDDVATDLPLAEQHVVVPADETQRAAIAKARSGRSFIIQGPPGTGKSQTITNLVADYVAQGKRVLFVCAKRAAVDVVHARLRKQGLDELCALIHDSQADKRAFIHAMRATYESWLAATDDPGNAEAERQHIVDTMNHRLGMLRRIDAAMSAPPVGSDRDLRALLERGAQLRDAGIEPEATVPAESAGVPSVAEWYRDAPIVHALAQTLVRLGEPPALALHPLADVRAELLAAERPADRVAAATAAAAEAIGPLVAQLNAAGLDAGSLTLGDLRALLALAETAAQLTPGARAVLMPASPAATTFFGDATAMADARAAAQQAAAAAAGWREPLTTADARAGLDLATAKERSPLRFLSGAWRSLKKAVRARYDFGRHAVRPTITSVLTDLVGWQQADEQLRQRQAGALTAYGVPDLEPLRQRVEAAHAVATPAVAAARDDADRLDMLVAARGSVGAALDAIDGLFDVTAGVTTRTIADVSTRVARLRGAAGAMRELVGDLRRLHAASPAVVHAVRTRPLNPEQLEVLVLDRAIDQFGLEHLDVERFTGRELAAQLDTLRREHGGLLDANAAVARGRARRRFREHVAISAASTAQLTSARAKEFKQAYAAGRRELEHEFQKTMRYKSIRDLVSGPAGPVVMDLRPIWLMSPLSVSDTLPLDPGHFDVVVFDEASQIPLEEAIPALYRAHQTIVVGDQMQLPPTTFFSTGRSGDDEIEVAADESDDRRVAVVLDGDSFLAQSAAALPSTMLAWHYRSRSEDLIGFSNAAFYGGALATVPDRHRPPDGLGPIVVDGTDSADAAVDALLARNVSFHFLPTGVYEARRNPAEAAYVAETVRALLRRRLGLTIGIAAFSEAQQGEIEDALDRLADEDDEFGDLLDAEELREIDDQFVGLFVKNLENIQGDERDVIIISVCYGPGPDGKMRMNFGPINQQGGEKRLNVIFSRARQHMAIVSSIKAPQITNDHNDGANALRRFLDYAEALSEGDVDGAQRVLHEANPQARRRAAIDGHSAVIDGLAAALRSRGLVVEEHHGRSRFRCDLAVRRPTDEDHRVAVLVDTRERAAFAPTDERALTHPAVLAGFGWTVVHVLTKDWYADPDTVVASVEAALGG